MSYDLYFWPAGAATNPGRLADRLAEEKGANLVPDERVLAFRAELLRRWPELSDMIAPWHHDLGQRQPWGYTDLADRYVGVTLPYGWAGTSALPVLAGAFGLDTYDPQSGRLTPPASQSRDHSALDDVTHVRGWLAEEHVVQLFQQISARIGYAYDHLDEAALTGALDETSDEADDGWFEYPLAGLPPLVVGLARSPGSSRVAVRITGTMNLVLAAGLETLVDLL